MQTQCEDCWYYTYDEDYEEYTCEMALSLDEDEYAGLMQNKRSTCPYYRRGNEYTVVKKQSG